MRDALREIKWFVQRGRRGYADCDIWNFESYLAGIIIAGLKHLKEKGIGCPSELWDEGALNNERHKWDATLDVMTQGFEAYLEWVDGPPRVKGKGFCRDFDHTKHALLEQKFRRGMELFCAWFPGLWD